MRTGENLVKEIRSTNGTTLVGGTFRVHYYLTLEDSCRYTHWILRLGRRVSTKSTDVGVGDRTDFGVLSETRSCCVDSVETEGLE